MFRESLQIRITEVSKCSKVGISNFHSVGCKNGSKLEINSLHNLKTSGNNYTLNQYVYG